MEQQQPQQASQRRPLSDRTASPARTTTTTTMDTLTHEMDELGHVLDALPDGVVIADEAGCIQLVNRQVEALFGYPSGSLLGQLVEELMPHRFRSVHPGHRAAYAAEPRTRPMGSGLQLLGRRRDGSEFPVEISLSPITVGGAALVLGTIRDVTAQRQTEQRAREELAGRLTMLQTVLDVLPVGVYLARGWDGELVLANRQIASIWGGEWQMGQPMVDFIAASGSRVYDLQGRELFAERLATLRALRSGASVWHQREVIRHADGTALSLLVNAVPLDPQAVPYLSEAHTRPNDFVPIVLVVHQDVSALADAERMKDEFVALAAHELRNPVASLLGYAQMLLQATGPGRQDASSAQRGTDYPESTRPSDVPAASGVTAIPQEWQDEAAMAVVEASQQLASLTDDLLDATRLQANRLELRLEPLEVGALVRRVVKRQRLATEHHTIITTLPPDDAPLLVEGDAQRLEQVLTNLLSNAIKYSPTGGIIEVVAMPRDHNYPAAGGVEPGAVRAWAQVEVRDHGIGIPADQFDRIFGRFGRATNAREHGLPGTGLRLYLSRELIERQGGHIWFESHEGIGTTFTFELPCWAEPV